MMPDARFTGTWSLSDASSRLAGPPPQRWIQTIALSSDGVHISEQIEFADGHAEHNHVETKFDRDESAVHESPLPDSTADTCEDPAQITATEKRGSGRTLTETVRLSTDGQT